MTREEVLVAIMRETGWDRAKADAYLSDKERQWVFRAGPREMFSAEAPTIVEVLS